MHPFHSKNAHVYLFFLALTCLHTHSDSGNMSMSVFTLKG